MLTASSGGIRMILYNVQFCVANTLINRIRKAEFRKPTEGGAPEAEVRL